MFIRLFDAYIVIMSAIMYALGGLLLGGVVVSLMNKQQATIQTFSPQPVTVSPPIRQERDMSQFNPTPMPNTVVPQRIGRPNHDGRVSTHPMDDITGIAPPHMSNPQPLSVPTNPHIDTTPLIPITTTPAPIENPVTAPPGIRSVPDFVTPGNGRDTVDHGVQPSTQHTQRDHDTPNIPHEDKHSKVHPIDFSELPGKKKGIVKHNTRAVFTEFY